MTFRPPIITRLWPKDTGAGYRAASDIPPNLIAQIGGGLQPFSQTDWPNPRSYPFPVENRTYLWQGNAIIGAGVQVPPPYAYDYPNPRGYPFPAENRTFLWQGNALIGGGLQPFDQTDWPNPRGYVYPIALRTHLLDGAQYIGQDIFFGAPGQAPANLDWPNPRGYIPGIELRTWLQNLSQSTLLQIGQMYGAVGQVPTYDWQNPRGYQYPSDLRGFIATPFPDSIPPFVPPVVVAAPTGGPGDDDHVKPQQGKKTKRRQIITLPNGMRIVADEDKARELLARAEQGARAPDVPPEVAPRPAAAEGASPSVSPSAPPVALQTPSREVSAFAALTNTELPQTFPAGTASQPSGIAEATLQAVSDVAQIERRRRDEEETLMLLMAA